MHSTLLLVILGALAASDWKEARFGDKPLLLDPRCEPLSTAPLGPLVKLGNGNVLAVDDAQALASKDEGKTWTARPLFQNSDKFRCREERALLRTRDGALILAFLNVKELVFQWDQVQGGPRPECRLPVYITRSLDDGNTWEEPQLLQDGYCGALRNMIQLRGGRVVLASQVAVTSPGRHVSLAYVSDDEGKSWKKSNLIDLGEYGQFGDHGGGIEATLAELKDGRLWMLLRTYRGCFTEAFSEDQGLTWKDIRPSKIAASGSPGLLRRLQDGRLVLLWNRFIDPVKRTGRREQLSMAFSDDDGRTWTDPAVVAYDPMKPGDQEPKHRIAYPYLYEHIPGELWVTTMQGPLRVKLREDDFCPRRLSDKTYPVRFVEAAKITLDGRADEPEWAEAHVEKGFTFPWKDIPAPATEFRAICDKTHLYFHFRVHDEDIVVLEKLRDEEDAVFEDRAEWYFARDDKLNDYYCVEVDSRGRPFDYRGAYYRRLDPSWHLEGLEAKAAGLPQGYEVEIRMPLASLQAMGLPSLLAGQKVRCGLYRAEFSHDRSGRKVVARESIHNRGRQLDGPPPIEAWMSWVDPQTVEPDFHVPSSLGFLQLAK